MECKLTLQNDAKRDAKSFILTIWNVNNGKSIIELKDFNLLY